MGCYPLITKPTHFCKSLNSLLDNIYTNSKFCPYDNGIIINDISDHLPIFTIYNFYKVNNKKGSEFKYTRQLKDKNINNFKQNILKFDWNYIYNNEFDTNTLFDRFINDLVTLFNNDCPIVKVKILKKIRNPGYIMAYYNA